MVGSSVFYKTDDVARKASKDSVDQLDQELEAARKAVEEATEADRQLSSHVWICTSTHAISKVEE